MFLQGYFSETELFAVAKNWHVIFFTFYVSLVFRNKINYKVFLLYIYIYLYFPSLMCFFLNCKNILSDNLNLQNKIAVIEILLDKCQRPLQVHLLVFWLTVRTPSSI